jgi:hypothetical protein
MGMTAVSWDGIRGTLQWLLLLLLIGTIAAVGVAVHWWTAKDALLIQAVQTKLDELLPDCTVEFSSVRLAGASHFELTDLTLRARETHVLLAEVPRVVAEFDPELLTEHRQVAVRSVSIHSPEVLMLRDPDGRWSWEGISPPLPSAVASPAVSVTDGSIRIGIVHQNDSSNVNTAPFSGRIVPVAICRGLQLSLSPQAHRRFRLSGAGNADALGPVSLQGYIDGNHGDWRITGEAGAVRIRDPLLEMAGQFSPSMRTQLAELRRGQLRRDGHSPSETAPAPLRIAALTNSHGQPVSNHDSSLRTPPPEGTEESSPSLFRADVSLTFEIGRARDEEQVDYRLAGEVEHGQISELLLPIPLYDLEGSFEVTPAKVRIRNLRAVNGESSLFVDGAAQRVGEDWRQDFQVRATRLQMDERVRVFLTPGLKAAYDALRPTGMFDLDLHFSHEPNQPPEIQLRKFTAIDMRVLCEAFQYPVEQMRGTITQRTEDFYVDLKGTASGQPVTVTGTIRQEDAYDMQLTVRSEGIPIDRKLIDAFQEQEELREVLESLRPGGLVDFDARLVRDRRTQGEFKLAIEGTVREGRVNFVGFPYELTEVSGTFSHDPFLDDLWLFEDLQGHHGDARVTGRGVFVGEDSDEEHGLALELALVRIPIDHDLQKATLVANPDLRPVWSDFGLDGMLDVERARIGWRPGDEVEVELEGIQWKEGRIMPLALPYQWDQVNGALEWDGEKLKIHSLHGMHGETYLHIDGTRPEAPAYVQSPVSDAVAWRLHLADLKIVRLNPDDELRRALPEALREAVNTVDLRKPLNLQLAIDLKGWNSDEELVTARWQCLATFQGNTLHAGVPLTDVTGRARIQQGVWNGERLFLEGSVELETVRALDMPFTNVRGPFRMEGDRLLLGTPEFGGRKTQYSAENPYAGEQLRGDLYTGRVGLDAAVYFPDSGVPLYNLDVSVQDVELAEWAADWDVQARRLMGKLNASTQLQGRGTSAVSLNGQGWVQVTPAALFELPVFTDIFAILSFRPPDNTAFNYGYGDFTIEQGVFNFSEILLVGDALSLKGRGTVGFAGPERSALNLDFYSKATNRVPFLRPLIERFGSNWVRVQVVGTVSKPQPLIQPRIGPLDEAFRGFMDAVERGQLRTAPPRPPRNP